MREPLDERIVARIWYGQHLRRDDLVTTDRRKIRVVWRGRANNGDAGPDFRDAILALPDGTLLRGDVELHMSASDWWGHGHHRDPRYNNVILHVVLHADTPRPLECANGGTAPTLDLSKHLEMPLAELVEYLHTEPAAQSCDDPCRQRIADLYTHGNTQKVLEQLGLLLDESGKARFEQKVAVFESELAGRPETKPAQIAYEALADALGYSRNRAPFRRLARRAHLDYILPLAQRNREHGEAVLLGAAGLLPGSATALAASLDEFRLRADMADGWSRHARTLAACALDPKPLARSDWHWGQTRPDNYPTRRAVALAYLLAYKSNATPRTDFPLLDELLGLISGAANVPSIKPVIKALHTPLVVSGDGYWTEHCDWGGKRLGNKVDLLGASRAADITVNVLLPFAAAYGELCDEPQLVRGAHHLYRLHPKLSDNAIAKEMLEQILGAAEPQVRSAATKLVNTAQRQQGLLHIYAHWCKLHVCAECAFSAPHHR